MKLDGVNEGIIMDVVENKIFENANNQVVFNTIMYLVTEDSKRELLSKEETINDLIVSFEKNQKENLSNWTLIEKNQFEMIKNAVEKNPELGETKIGDQS